MHLDVQTVSILYLFTLLISTAQMYFAWRINKDSRVLSRVCFAFVAACFGLPLIGLREMVPDVVSYSIGNMMLLFYQFMMVDAVRANNEQPYLKARTILLALAVHTPLLNYFVYIDPSHAGRAAVNFAYHLPLTAYCAYAFLSHYGRRSLAEKILGFTFLGSLVVNLMVAPYDVMQAAGYEGARNSLRTDLVTFSYLVVTLMLTYGFINLANSRLTASLARIADFDDLTGCFNRRAFYNRVERSLSRTQDRTFACLLLDLDHFKAVNDTYGHHAGDRVLSEVGKLLRQVTRPSDTVGRLGGEEFAALLSDVTEAQTMTIAERIRQDVADLRFETDDGGQEPFGITISIGVMLHEAGDRDETFDTYFTRADKALYTAKERGRNSVVNWADL